MHLRLVYEYNVYSSIIYSHVSAFPNLFILFDENIEYLNKLGNWINTFKLLILS